MRALGSMWTAACITWSPTSHGSPLHMAPHFTWPPTSHGPPLHMAPHFTWPPTSHGPPLHMAPHFTWPPTSHGPPLHMAPHFTWPPTSHGLPLHWVGSTTRQADMPVSVTSGRGASIGHVRQRCLYWPHQTDTSKSHLVQPTTDLSGWGSCEPCTTGPQWVGFL